MTPREINRDDVREGDKIRIEHGRGMSVQGRVLQVGNAGWVEFDGPLVSHFVGLDYVDTTITLLDRPLPPLPTDEGTVVGNRERMMTLVRRDTAWWYGDAIYQNDEAGPLDPSKWVLLGEVSA